MEPKKPIPTEPWDFWRILNSATVMLVLIPNGYVRLEPLINDIIFFLSEHGPVVFLEQVLPTYIAAWRDLYGWNILWTGLLLVISFTYASMAGKTLFILLSRLILKLGFRIEESADSVLLHPDEEARP